MPPADGRRFCSNLTPLPPPSPQSWISRCATTARWWTASGVATTKTPSTTSSPFNVPGRWPLSPSRPRPCRCSSSSNCSCSNSNNSNCSRLRRSPGQFPEFLLIVACFFPLFSLLIFLFLYNDSVWVLKHEDLWPVTTKNFPLVYYQRKLMFHLVNKTTQCQVEITFWG